VDFGFVMNVVHFIRPFNKVLNFPASWENEVLLNARFYLFHSFNYKSVISWRDVTPGLWSVSSSSLQSMPHTVPSMRRVCPFV